MPNFMLSIEENGAFSRIYDAACIQHAGNIHSGTKWSVPAAANASWQVQAESVMVPPSRSQRPVWRQKAPGRLSSWPHPASVHQHGTLLLVYDQYKQGRNRLLAGMARYEGKYDTGAPHVTRILCAVVKVSIAYLQQKPSLAGQGINRFVQSSVDTLSASWVMSVFQTVKRVH